VAQENDKTGTLLRMSWRAGLPERPCRIVLGGRRRVTTGLSVFVIVVLSLQELITGLAA